MIFTRFFSGKSDNDSCTLYSDRTLINRRNVRADPKSAYRADRDFLLLVLKSRIIASAMTVLGFENKLGQPNNFPLPKDLHDQSKLSKQQYLHKAAGQIVDKLVFTHSSIEKAISDCISIEYNRDKRFPCRFAGCLQTFKYDGKSRRTHEMTHNPPPIPEDQYPKPGHEDDIYSYNCALLEEGLFFMNFLDAVKEGDGARVIRQYKFLLLFCKADGQHSMKYALECLYQAFLTEALLSPQESERFIWNRCVNTSGGVGKNIPLDLDVEHSNRFLKQSIKNLGANITEKAITRICQAEAGARCITHNIDTCVHKITTSGKHTQSSVEKDLMTLLNRAVMTDVFNVYKSRHYNHFKKFERDRMANLKMTTVFKWIDEHKKDMIAGVKAR